jgi:hypothetical protein
MATEPQEILPEVGDMITSMLPAASNLMTTQSERDAEEIVLASVTSKGKKRRRAYSGTTKSKSLMLIVLSH